MIRQGEWPCIKLSAVFIAYSHEHRKVRYAAVSSKTRPITADARAILSTKSGFFCAPYIRRLTPHQQERLSEAFVADKAHISVEVAYLHGASAGGLPFKPHPPKANAWPHTSSSAYQPVPSPKSLASGRTLRKWKDAFLAYFDTGGAGNGPTEAINGIIELGRRIARGYRNPTSYQLRMLLIAGGLDASTHTQL